MWFVYVHRYNAIVCNAILKRLQSAAKDEASGALGELRQLRADIAADVQGLPQQDRIGPRAKTESQLDLNQAKLFLSDASKRQRLLRIVTDRMSTVTITFRGRTVQRQVPLSVMLTALFDAWKVWNMHTIATPSVIEQYAKSVALFVETWTAFGWKPTLWVHWFAFHSHTYLSMYKSIFAFSSIPTEYKHRSFKRDVAHSCMAWKMTKPVYSHRSLAHVVRMHALDLVLMKDKVVKGRKKRVL